MDTKLNRTEFSAYFLFVSSRNALHLCPVQFTSACLYVLISWTPQIGAHYTPGHVLSFVVRSLARSVPRPVSCVAAWALRYMQSCTALQSLKVHKRKKHPIYRKKARFLLSSVLSHFGFFIFLFFRKTALVVLNAKDLRASSPNLKGFVFWSWKTTWGKLFPRGAPFCLKIFCHVRSKTMIEHFFGVPSESVQTGTRKRYMWKRCGRQIKHEKWIIPYSADFL